jgi:uncharacterized protein YyaL (SSP411 family)
VLKKFPVEANSCFKIAQFPIGGKATAYVCQNYECKLPTTEVDEMLKLLNV